MEVTGAAQSRAGGGPSGGILARVVHQQDRDVELRFLQPNPSPLPTPLSTSYVEGMTSGAVE